MATVRPRKVCLQNRQHAVVLHCWELPGHQSGQFIHGHFCRRKLHVDALQLQRGRLMEHSEAQFKALNVLRANLPWGQSALSGTTHRAGLAGEWSSWAQNTGQVHRKAFHLCFSVWASKTWSSSENQLLCNWIYCDLYSASRDLLGVYPKRAAMLLKGELSPLDCSMTLQWHFRFIKSLRIDEQEVEMRYEPFASTSPTLTCFELGTWKKIHKCKGWEMLLQPTFSRSGSSAKELVFLWGWQQNGEEDWEHRKGCRQDMPCRSQMEASFQKYKH